MNLSDVVVLVTYWYVAGNEQKLQLKVIDNDNVVDQGADQVQSSTIRESGRWWRQETSVHIVRWSEETTSGLGTESTEKVRVTTLCLFSNSSMFDRAVKLRYDTDCYNWEFVIFEALLSLYISGGQIIQVSVLVISEFVTTKFFYHIIFYSLSHFETLLNDYCMYGYSINRFFLSSTLICDRMTDDSSQCKQENEL